VVIVLEREENVLRLQIPMDDLVVVKVAQATQHIDETTEDVLHRLEIDLLRADPATDHISERALGQLHHHQEIGDAVSEQLDHIAVLRLSHHSNLTGQMELIFPLDFREHFHSNSDLDLAGLVFPFVNCPEASLAQLGTFLFLETKIFDL
jgi:hypothetical protein